MLKDESDFQNILFERQSLLRRWVTDNEVVLLPSTEEMIAADVEAETPLFIRTAVLILEVEGINGETFSDCIRFPGMSNIHAKGLLYHAGEAQ